MSSLFDRRPIVPAIAIAVAVYLFAWLFVTGGILDRFARGRPTGAYGFFAASGVFFFRFLRLAVVAVIVYTFLFVYVHQWLFAKWYVGATRDLPFERTAFYWRLLMYAMFAVLLALTTTVFDYAKVRAVVEDRRSMIGALVAGARFHHPQPGAGRGLYLVNVIVFLVVAGLWALVAPGAGGSGVSMWAGIAASQCYVLARLIVKLQFLASETAFFQRSLAHWDMRRLRSVDSVRSAGRSVVMSGERTNERPPPTPSLRPPHDENQRQQHQEDPAEQTGTARRTTPSTPAGAACRGARHTRARSPSRRPRLGHEPGLELREHRLRLRVVDRDASPSTAATVCRWRVSIVPVTAMPTLPPMLRIRLNRLVALPIRCGAIGCIVTVVSGTNVSAMPAPCSSCGQKMSQ